MIFLYLFLSVIIGALLVYFMKPSNQIVRILLAFSGAYLLSITVLHLLPEVYTASNNAQIVGICIITGIVLQSVLESFSKGAEHGHMHYHGDGRRFPILLFISLCIHAFSEGLPIHHVGENLLWAIVIHKVPIAIVLTSFLVSAKFSIRTTAIFITLFALMSPLGAYTSEQVEMLQEYMLQITAVIIGVFLHISTIILFESTENHKFNLQKFIAILLGISLTFFTL